MQAAAGPRRQSTVLCMLCMHLPLWLLGSGCAVARQPAAMALGPAYSLRQEQQSIYEHRSDPTASSEGLKDAGRLSSDIDVTDAGDGVLAAAALHGRQTAMHMYGFDRPRPGRGQNLGAQIVGAWGSGADVGAGLSDVNALPTGAMQTVVDSAGPGRKLMHGNRKPWQYTTCSRCYLVSCGSVTCTGHCKTRRKLHTCRTVANLATTSSFGPSDDLSRQPGDVVLVPDHPFYLDYSGVEFDYDGPDGDVEYDSPWVGSDDSDLNEGAEEPAGPGPAEDSSAGSGESPDEAAGALDEDPDSTEARLAALAELVGASGEGSGASGPEEEPGTSEEEGDATGEGSDAEEESSGGVGDDAVSDARDASERLRGFLLGRGTGL